MLRTIIPPFASGQFGWAVAGDPSEGLIAGAPLTTTGGRTFTGAVLIESGAQPRFVRLPCTLMLEVDLLLVRDITLTLPITPGCGK